MTIPNELTLGCLFGPDFSILNEQNMSESVYNMDIMGESVLNIILLICRCLYSDDISNKKITYSRYVLKVEC